MSLNYAHILPVAVLLVLHEGGPMDQGLRCVPDDVGDGLLRVDPKYGHVNGQMTGA